MPSTTNYQNEARSDACSTVENFRDEILDQLMSDGQASDDLYNDYDGGDRYHHESHVDKWYNMTEAAAILDQLDEYEETDSGLWEGQPMKEALSTCAAFTYGNAVLSEWADLIREINGQAEEIIDEFATEENDLEDEIESSENLAEEVENDEDIEDAEEQAESYREEAAVAQGQLDTLADRKREALEKMINAVIA